MLGRITRNSDKAIKFLLLGFQLLFGEYLLLSRRSRTGINAFGL
ncbi:hypothetical protein JCM19236_6203 [Vibrio sp. JCM 19236]|nr:hypothetical protein JCM19236_6203 [Vibrio sp. JCM 19236]